MNAITRKHEARDSRNTYVEAATLLKKMDDAHLAFNNASAARFSRGNVHASAEEDALWAAYRGARRAVEDLMIDALEAEERCRHDTRGHCDECDSAQEEHLDQGGPTYAEQQAAAMVLK